MPLSVALCGPHSATVLFDDGDRMRVDYREPLDEPDCVVPIDGDAQTTECPLPESKLGINLDRWAATYRKTEDMSDDERAAFLDAGNDSQVVFHRLRRFGLYLDGTGHLEGCGWGIYDARVFDREDSWCFTPVSATTQLPTGINRKWQVVLRLADQWLITPMVPDRPIWGGYATIVNGRKPTSGDDDFVSLIYADDDAASENAMPFGPVSKLLRRLAERLERDTWHDETAKNRLAKYRPGIRQ